nr:MAG TPA: Envelope protein [Caudoviricetes sp.]
MNWLLYELLNILFTFLCYLTNWFVVLFCDEYGNLPPIFKLWQTWDDTCNPRFHVLEVMPSFLQYDYDRHYREYVGADTKLKKLGRTRCYVEILDPNFSVKERIQRYICRVMWLMRNNSYGFAFYLLGRKIRGTDLTVFKEKCDDKGHKMYFAADMSKPIWKRPWVISCDMPINRWMRWEVFAGWKVAPKDKDMSQRMIAHRVTFRFGAEDE